MALSTHPIGRAANFVLISFILHYHCNGVTAWQTSTGSTSSTCSRPFMMAKKASMRRRSLLLSSSPRHASGVHVHVHVAGAGAAAGNIPSPRRQFLSQIVGTTITAATVVMSPHQAIAETSSTLNANSARDQWRKGSNTIDDLLKIWSTEEWAEKVGGGDEVRIRIGTQDATSPLFQIGKAFKALRDSEFVEDEIEFVETSEEFMEALYRADSYAASSNSKTGSGKQTPPAVSLESSKQEVVDMQRIAKKLNGMVK